jgi:flavin reductase (DIM6/NTAB) family NADH-FMN oxidoreductase RutF
MPSHAFPQLAVFTAAQATARVMPGAGRQRGVGQRRGSRAQAAPVDEGQPARDPKISMMNMDESIDRRLGILADCKEVIQHGEFRRKVAVVLDQHFRDLMAGVCAPVAIVTTADDAGAHGATVSSLASVSLRPPLVSIALDRNSTLLARIFDTRRFGVNVLGSAQHDLAVVFASRGVERFNQVRWSMVDGLPRLEGAVGWATCDVHQTVEAGDHLLLIGLVGNAASSPQPPLIYGYRTFGTHSHFQQRPRKPITDHIAACAR